MYLAITNYGLIEHELLNKVFSIPVNYENDIWFNIGNTDINYSIVRAGLKLLGMVAAVLGVIGTIVRMIAKSRKK